MHQKDFKVVEWTYTLKTFGWIPICMNIQEQSVHTSGTFLQTKSLSTVVQDNIKEGLWKL